MSAIDFISESPTFVSLWDRANEGVATLSDIPSTDLLYFDSIDISGQKLFDLIRALLKLKCVKDFATLVLKPDPFDYFHFHFGKYPGFVHGIEHTDDEFFEALMMDPGGSPADCLWANSERYAVLPIPGQWFIYADRQRDMGVLSGPSEIMEFARSFYPFFLNPAADFKIVG
ncbi:hypothetical protein [Paraburkholderia bryophila]|jgi:hypothetical protein|uniref:Uncharacterized protein n=1 Tax=Paraburkholderia bryophila TaxID=420952 RepID=A0A329C445_9BURK|nr:hypothetical protein [Paraburkholderia bryophila]RAS28847.1 hypothetical protein BX591_111126 [Paraburkholderia bryophila]